MPVPVRVRGRAVRPLVVRPLVVRPLVVRPGVVRSGGGSVGRGSVSGGSVGRGSVSGGSVRRGVDDAGRRVASMGDGDGWANCDAGHRHWGRFGAAGVLLYHQDPEPHVLLQKRSRLSNGGGTWGLLGGARHSHENPIEGALREASEESTLDPSVVRVHWLAREDHGGWSYDTVIGSV